jgi:hypothetical protein
MAEPLGTSIRIFLVDGTPDGLRLVEKSNWTGQAIVCSRAQYPAIRNRPEFLNPGIYCLLGPSEDEASKPGIYIGESDVLRDRLDQHTKTKDFWTRFVAFTSKDLTLNKAHIRYLESRLVVLAGQAKTWHVENRNAPQTPGLAAADVADAEGFLREMLVIYPVLGVDAFEIAQAKPGGAALLHLSGKHAEGRGRDEPEGFIVFEGATARADEVDSIHATYTTLRAELLDSGVLRPEGGALRLTQDYRFNSPSAAAAALLGRSANGRLEWKDASGRTLKEIQEAALGRGD